MKTPIVAVTSLVAMGLAAAPGAEERPRAPELSGYLQLDYRRSTSAPQAAPAHEVNVRRARLGAAGEVAERVSYSLSVQGDGLSAGSASLIDAVVAVKLAPWARLQAGQFKYDFDLEGRDSATALVFSDRPFVTQTVAGGLNGGSTPSSPSASFRDRGVSVAGETRSGRFAYSLGAFQGNGRGSDDNATLAWVARLQLAPAAGLRLSAGVLDSDTADAGASDEADAASGRYRALTAGASLQRGRLFLRGEFYAAERPGVGSARDVDGFYLVGAWSFDSGFEALLRYQQLDDALASPGGSLRSMDLGARYWIARKGARGGSSVLVNVLLRGAAAGPVKGPSLLNDGRGAALTDGGDVEPVVVVRFQVQF